MTATRIIDQLTLEEKASLMSGANFWNTKSIDRLGIRSIMLTDGPHGLRKQGGAADHLGLNASIPATCFPTSATLANSWDIELIGQIGEALGAEAAAEDVAVLLGPGLNIKRNPLAGRNFEYFSEDPLLSGTMAAAYIRGVQSQGVAACAKHFAVNSQETHRMSIDEIVDERALHEVYLEGFRIAITQGKPWTMMSSYNKINGTYANENTELLDEILRRRWGFEGLVVTDWGGNNDRVSGLMAGNALEMPSTNGVTDAEIVAAVRAGALDEAVLDARVEELLTLLDRTSRTSGTTVDHDAQHELAIDAARRSIVLLSNPTGTLPLSRTSGKVAVVGDFARTPRFQGAGSSLVNATQVSNALDALKRSGLSLVGYQPGFARRDSQSEKLLNRALDLAKRADVVVAFLGLDESAEAEGVDRQHLRLAANQLQLVDELLAQGSTVVVVLAGGAPVELPFADQVAAIVHGYLPGQGGGQAIADVLAGVVNPSGKLAETYPIHYGDVASSARFARAEATSEHRESIYLGYRYFDKNEAPVRYPFGHGLSYTTFSYSDLQADADEVTLSITNTGKVAGAEIVQVYVEAPNGGKGNFRAVRELHGFAKVHLEPGQVANVTIDLSEHAFDAYDAQTHQWRTVPGTYRVWAGASSRDLRSSAEVHIAGETWDLAQGNELPSYASGHVKAVPGHEFARLLGRRLPPSDWNTNLPLTRDDIIAQTKGRGGFASVLYALINKSSDVLMALGRPHAANNTRFAMELPFRSIPRMGGKHFDDNMLDGLLLMVNRHFFRGSAHLIRAALRRRRTTSTSPSSRP